MKLHVSWRRLPTTLWFIAYKDAPVRMYQSEEKLAEHWQHNPNYRVLKATVTYEDVTP